MSPPSTPLDDETVLLSIAALNLKKFPAKECTGSCTTCLKREKDLGRPMRRCGKCHAAFYCSKECQSRDWPVHKEMCGDPGLTKRLPKLIRNLILSPILLIPLQLCLILVFDLFQCTRWDEFLLAQVDVAVEPADLADFADIFSEKESAKKHCV